MHVYLRQTTFDSHDQKTGHVSARDYHVAFADASNILASNIKTRSLRDLAREFSVASSGSGWSEGVSLDSQQGRGSWNGMHV